MCAIIRFHRLPFIGWLRRFRTLSFDFGHQARFRMLSSLSRRSRLILKPSSDFTRLRPFSDAILHFLDALVQFHTLLSSFIYRFRTLSFVSGFRLFTTVQAFPCEFRRSPFSSKFERFRPILYNSEKTISSCWVRFRELLLDFVRFSPHNFSNPHNKPDRV